MCEMFKNLQPLKHKPHKMFKHTQAIFQQQPTDCLSVFEHGMG